MAATREVDGSTLRGMAEQLLPLYRDSFSGPPWHEPAETIAGYPERLAAQTALPGAHGRIATVEERLARRTGGLRRRSCRAERRSTTLWLTQHRLTYIQC